MAEPTRSCPRCARVVLESKLVDELCPVCVAGMHAPRPHPTPGKWAPTSLGVLSLFVNPMFVTSVFAIGRARSWLEYADTRDASGEHSHWHAQLRSNAIWGMVLAAFQPIALAVTLTMSFAFQGEPVEPAPAEAHDERAEILALLESDDSEARQVAMCQLDATAPHAEDRRLIESAMRSGDAETQACGHLALATLVGVPIAHGFIEIPIEVRAAMLDVLERRGDPREPELRDIHLATIGPL